MPREEKPGSVPQPEPLKEGEVLPGVKKDKDWDAEHAPAPEAEPLKEGEVLPGVKDGMGEESVARGEGSKA